MRLPLLKKYQNIYVREHRHNKLGHLEFWRRVEHKIEFVDGIIKRREREYTFGVTSDNRVNLHSRVGEEVSFLP